MLKVLSKSLFVAWLLVITLSNYGCGPCDKMPPYAQQVAGRPFTYRITGANGCLSLRPHLLRVWVFDSIPDPNIPPYIKVRQWHDLNIKVYWEIIARKPIRAEGFELTIGQVPEGFEQVIPPPDQVFTPNPDKKYFFKSETDWPCYQTYGTDSGFLDYVEKHP